jgi:hypothetical protein
MDPIREMCREDVQVDLTSSRSIIKKNLITIRVQNKIHLNLKKNLCFTRKNGTSSPRTFQKDYTEGTGNTGGTWEDPFVYIDLSPFKNLEAYDLASIDLFFDITNSYGGALAPQVIKFQNFIISGTKNYGFIEYIQYRNEIAFVYFLDTIRIDDDSFLSGIDYSRIKQLQNLGAPGGSRYSDYNLYVNYILRVDSFGVDVYIIADYSSDVELLTQLLMMTLSLKDRGNVIIKIKFNSLVVDIITILCIIFDTVAPFKPATSNLNENDMYIIGKFYKKSNSGEISKLLKECIKKCEYDSNFENGFLESSGGTSVTSGIIDSIKKFRDDLQNEKTLTKSVHYVVNKIKMYLNL